MDRLNSEGLPRFQLKFALTQPRIVRQALRIDRCLLCLRPGVNEAGLCDVCHALLRDDEAALAQKWMTGEGP